MDSTWIEINVDALRENIRFIKSHLKEGVKLLGVVKGNCYGYGMKNLLADFEREGVDWFGVVLPQEAYEIRRLGFKQPILIFGYVFPENYEEVLKADLRIGLERYEDAVKLNETAKKMGITVPVHIRVDSGMGRLGYLPTEESAQEVKKIFELSNLKPEGIMTHFAIGDERMKDYTKIQFKRYQNFVERLEELGVFFDIHHCANSGATLHWPEMQWDMVRVGSAIYGVYPSESMEKDPTLDFKPVMSLKSRLVSLKELPKDEYVGYGCTYKTTRPTKVSVVPVGYVDGAYRTLANKGEVLLHGRRVPIIGKICMDQLMIDVTDIDNPEVGDEVVFFGTQEGATITLDEHARMTGESTTPSGIVNRMGYRTPIYYLHKNLEDTALEKTLPGMTGEL